MLKAGAEDEFETTFASLGPFQADAALIGSDPFSRAGRPGRCTYYPRAIVFLGGFRIVLAVGLAVTLFGALRNVLPRARRRLLAA
jgi:hypothetical protein